MSNFTLTAPGAFPSHQDVFSGKEPAPDMFMLSMEPPAIGAPPDAWPAAEINITVRNGGVNIVTAFDTSQVERLMEKRDLFQARRLVVSSESGVRF